MFINAKLSTVNRGCSGKIVGKRCFLTLMRRHFLFKVSSFIVLCFFSFQQIVWAEGSAFTPAVRYEHHPVNLIPDNIDLPYQFAEKREVYSSEDGQNVIIHLQDAHSSLSAQYSIVELLDSLISDYDLNMIALEGAEGIIDTSLLRTFPDSEVREKTAGLLMKEGHMGAGEFFDITRNNDDILLCGIEDSELYRKNLYDFRKVIENHDLSMDDVEKYLEQVGRIEKKVYSAELFEFVKNEREHKKGDISFKEYWKNINSFVKKFGIDITAYKGIKSLNSVIEIESRIDFEKANTERIRLIDELSKIVDKRGLESLVLMSIEFKENKISSTRFHTYLKTLAENNDVKFDEYTDLYKFTEYISKYEGIDIFSLYKEISLLEREVRTRLYASEDEKEVYELASMANMLYKLYKVELTSEEFLSVREKLDKYDEESFASITKEKCMKYGVEITGGYNFSEMLSGVDAALAFYTVAAKRDRAMLLNTVEKMKAEGKKTAALITGGYHTEGLTRLMKDKGLSYLVIAPKFEEGKERPYIAVLTGKTKPYLDLLESGKYNIAVAAYFSAGEFDDGRLVKTICTAAGLSGLLSKRDWERTVGIWSKAYREEYEAFRLKHKDRFDSMPRKPVDPDEISGKLAGIKVRRRGNTAVVIYEGEPVMALEKEGETFSRTVEITAFHREIAQVAAESGPDEEGLIIEGDMTLVASGEEQTAFIDILADNVKTFVHRLKLRYERRGGISREDIERALMSEGLVPGWKDDRALSEKVEIFIAAVERELAILSEAPEQEESVTRAQTAAAPVAVISKEISTDRAILKKEAAKPEEAAGGEGSVRLDSWWILPASIFAGNPFSPDLSGSGFVSLLGGASSGSSSGSEITSLITYVTGEPNIAILGIILMAIAALLLYAFFKHDGTRGAPVLSRMSNALPAKILLIALLMIPSYALGSASVGPGAALETASSIAKVGYSAVMSPVVGATLFALLKGGQKLLSVFTKRDIEFPIPSAAVFLWVTVIAFSVMTDSITGLGHSVLMSIAWAAGILGVLGLTNRLTGMGIHIPLSFNRAFFILTVAIFFLFSPGANAAGIAGIGAGAVQARYAALMSALASVLKFAGLAAVSLFVYRRVDFSNLRESLTPFRIMIGLAAVTGLVLLFGMSGAHAAGIGAEAMNAGAVKVMDGVWTLVKGLGAFGGVVAAFLAFRTLNITDIKLNLTPFRTVVLLAMLAAVFFLFSPGANASGIAGIGAGAVQARYAALMSALASVLKFAGLAAVSLFVYRRVDFSNLRESLTPFRIMIGLAAVTGLVLLFGMSGAHAAGIGAEAMNAGAVKVMDGVWTLVKGLGAFGGVVAAFLAFRTLNITDIKLNLTPFRTVVLLAMLAAVFFLFSPGANASGIAGIGAGAVQARYAALMSALASVLKFAGLAAVSLFVYRRVDFSNLRESLTPFRIMIGLAAVTGLVLLFGMSGAHAAGPMTAFDAGMQSGSEVVGGILSFLGDGVLAGFITFVLWLSLRYGERVSETIESINSRLPHPFITYTGAFIGIFSLIHNKSANAAMIGPGMDTIGVVSPAVPLIAAGILAAVIFLALYISLRDKAGKLHENNIRVALGIPSDVFKELDSLGSIDGLKRSTGIDIIIPVDEKEDREKMRLEMEKKVRGLKIITAFIDRTVLEENGIIESSSGQISVPEKSFKALENITSDFVKKAEKDILRLMNPDMDKMTARAVKADFDAIKDLGTLRKKFRGVLNIYARLMDEVESLDVIDKSVYDLRMDSFNRHVLSSYEVSESSRALISSSGRTEKTRRKYISVSARTAADMKFIAGTISRMGITRDRASEFIHVRVEDKNITDANIGEYMEKTGLIRYLDSSNITVISAEDSENMDINSVVDIVRSRFGSWISAGDIAIGDASGVLRPDDGEKLEGEQSPVYVLMEGEGLASQLLMAVIEIVSTGGEVPAGLGTVKNEKGSHMYVYIPNMRRIDINALKAEIKRYENILTMA